jgi:hypothetical protein
MAITWATEMIIAPIHASSPPSLPLDTASQISVMVPALLEKRSMIFVTLSWEIAEKEEENKQTDRETTPMGRERRF